MGSGFIINSVKNTPSSLRSRFSEAPKNYLIQSCIQLKFTLYIVIIHSIFIYKAIFYIREFIAYLKG